MLKYKELYLKIGNRKIANLLEPIILKDTEFTFPMSSILIWDNVSDLPTFPDSNYGYLSNLKLPKVITIDKYGIDNPLGKFRKDSSININSIVSSYKKSEKKFKYLKPNSKRLDASNRTLLIFNYGALNTVHKYNQDPFNNYYKWYNAHTTAMVNSTNAVVGSSRHKFILFKLPSSVPSRIVLDKYVPSLTRAGMDNFITNGHLNVLDLWRFLTPEYQDTSALSKIPKDEYDNTTLLFQFDNKVSLLNLGILAGIVNEYELSSKLTKYPAKTVRKLMYIFINKLIVRAGVELENIDSKSTIPVDNITELEDGDEVPVSSDVIDVVEEEDVVENTETNVEQLIDDDTQSITIDETMDSVEDKVYTTNTELLDSKLKKLKEDKLVSKIQYEKIQSILDKQSKQTISIPGQRSKTLKELTTYTKDDLTISESDLKLPDSPYTKDDQLTEDTIAAIDKKYVTQVLEKDIISTIMSVQNNNLVVKNIDIEEKASVMGVTHRYTIELFTLDGKAQKLAFDIPKIEEDGTYTTGGNKYILRKQKSDLPIRKISRNRVALSSYYGKRFMVRAKTMAHNAGAWFRKELIKKYDVDKELKDLVLITVDNMEADLPTEYGIISRYVKSFTYKNMKLTFDYSNRAKFAGIKQLTDLDKYEKDGMVLVGVVSGKYLLMDTNNVIWKHVDSKYIEIGSVYEILNIDRTKEPIEYVELNIFKKSIPVGVILGYYVGFEKLLKSLKTKYTKITDGSRVSSNIDQYVLTFSDAKYLIEKDRGVSDLIISGFVSVNKYLKTIPHKALNNKGSYSVLLTKMELPISYLNEIKLLNTMFIDPMTKTLLEEMNEPTIFTDLLKRGCELLIDDNYRNPNDISNMVIKGYERLAGMMYNEIVKSIKTYENSSAFGKSKLNISPFAITSKLGEDSTSILVDDLNPIAELKQTEDVVSIGFGGRQKVGMSRDTRIMHPSEIGIISEATKDSSDVGISAYLTANPNIKNVRGMIQPYDEKKDSQAKIYSSTALLYPAANRDDPKRSNFANIMASHVIPINNSTVCPVRTGYEAIIPYRISDKFIIHAKQDGIVNEVTKSSITINYKSASKTAKPLSKKYKFKKWTTKEESGATYTHELVTNLKKGDKVKQWDTILFDKAFFEPDMFNIKRSVFKSSTNMNVALMEDIQTFEDSSAISKDASKKLSTIVTKVKSIIVDATDIIIDLVKVGDKLEPTSTLFSISDASIYKLKGLDDKTLEALKRLKQSSPKSKYKGTVSKVIAYYNVDEEELSDSLLEVVKDTNKQLASSGTKYTGRVNNDYSVDGKPLLSGKVELKIYIDIVETMGVADKLIFSNQLKSTVSEVFDYTMTTDDGTEIEAIFGAKSIANRIVTSSYIIGTTSKVLDVLSDKAVEMYFGK